jgi:hypothetical protein
MQENNVLINISLEDFSKEKGYKDWNNYTLKKSIKICGKTYERKAMEFTVSKKQSLKKYISKINEFMNLIANDWKKQIFERFNEYITEENKIKWFELLKIYYVSFGIRETGEIVLDIYFMEETMDDDYNLHNIIFVENKIESIIYNCGDCHDIQGDVNKYLKWR